MQVTLNKVFPLEGSVDDAWAILEDIEQVAGCMPGAEITETVDAENYKGSVKVKIGPMNVAFNGDIAVQEINPGEHQIHLIAKGQDSKGTSSASMDLTASIRSGESSASELTGDAEVTVNGKLANFGGRMMTQVSDQILGQFADSFRAKLAASATGAADTDAAIGDAETAEQPQVQEINGLKFAWQAIIGFIRSFFVRKAS